MFDTTSKYPNQVDPMIFFQDNSLDKMEIIKTYENLIAQKKYNEANEYISQQENVYRYSADYFNAIENRIYALQEYLLTEQKNKLIKFSNTEPTQVSKNTIWIV